MTKVASFPIRPAPSLLILALIGTFAPRDARASDWAPFGLQGVVTRSLAAAPDLLCAGTESDGVHCRDFSRPNHRWRSLGLAGKAITWLWIDPLAPEVIVAAVGEGGWQPPLLYRTLNGGSSWQPADGGLTHPPWAVDGVAGTSTVYGAGWGVWRSDDLGDSWTQQSLEGGLWSLEVAPTDAGTIWAGGETILFSGFTILSRDGGLVWEEVWNSNLIGDNQTADIAAHPVVDGLALTGHEGFVLRTLDHGGTFEEVLTAPARFFLDWDLGNTARVYAAGSPNFPGGRAFVSRDHGGTWSERSGGLEPRLVYRLSADGRRLGVAYAATDDGVYRFYGGGAPLCLDSRSGIDQIRVYPAPCPSPTAPGASIVGDAVVGDLGSLRLASHQVDLGEVECVVESADVALAEIDPPAPPPGEGLFVLVRPEGTADYGAGSAGLPRLPERGDCSP